MNTTVHTCCFYQLGIHSLLCINFNRPGDVISAGLDEKTGLQQILQNQLSPIGQTTEFDIDEVVGCWFRPNFTNQLYPYLPTHIKRPKEVFKTFLVHLPETAYLSLPSNYKIIAVPLFEIYNNSEKYGARLAALPYLLSKYNFIYQ